MKRKAVPKFLPPQIIDSFYQKGSNKKIDPKFISLQKHINRIAVHGFDKTALEKYFEPKKLEKVSVTYIKYKNKTIGFFVCCFLRNVDAKGVVSYQGKGFPGISPEIRTDRSNPDLKGLFEKIWKHLFMNFIQFYVKIHFKNLNNVKVSSNEIKLLYDILINKINIHTAVSAYLTKNLFSFINGLDKTSLTIYTLVENPIMYKSLKGFDFVGPKPTSSEIQRLQKLKPEKLLAKSYLKSKQKKQNKYLKKIKDDNLKDPKDLNIIVNMTPSEWRSFFEPGKDGKIDPYIQYYVWQNYRFPNYAFEIHLPITLSNIIKGLIPFISKMLSPKSD
jgi:hypothetical protein